ncbi:F-box domain containing protein [Trema orientale]|uniref:F-box domain containing protein n=1 Tax=Trema orientale TaxID=63057 RepID=A0A2P5FMM1_TREOI|nr:F-box domain containing protein [Trema orientale]
MAKKQIRKLGQVRILVKEEEEEEEEAPIYGDILEAVLSHVPLTHLVAASQVSRDWNKAVYSSLRHVNSVKPWLIVHVQSTRSPYATTSHAYDPRSAVWVQLLQPTTSTTATATATAATIKYVSALRSSHSTFLYMLSPSQFAFSSDPLRLTWHHARAPPLIWRTDPIVAHVGDRVVVAGGACDYEDDPLAVEIYDLRTRAWDTCESMPAILKDSAASISMSIAVHGGEMYVTEKCSGLTYSFDPESKTWRGPYDLRPDQGVFSTAVGFADGSLIAVGLLGNSESVKGVKMWKVRGESMECKEIGEMPKELVEKFVGESSCVPSVEVAAMGSFVFLHNPTDPGEVIQCEIADGECRWGSVRNAVANDGTRMQRMVIGCSHVDIGDLQRAMAMQGGNLRFAAKTFV